MRWWRAVTVFLALAVADATWVFYIRAIANEQHWYAAGIAVVLLVVGAYATVSYVEDKRMIVPAAVGAFVGTLLTSMYL